MPPVRSVRNRKPPPAGFSDIEDTLLDYTNKMRDAQNASTSGLKKHETLWPIFQITHARSRYIYDLYYEREAISKQLYEWLLKEGYADKNLIAKWKKNGYEKLCCLRCVQTKETNFGGSCICRVPRAQLKRQEDGEEGAEGKGTDSKFNRDSITDLKATRRQSGGKNSARALESAKPNASGHGAAHGMRPRTIWHQITRNRRSTFTSNADSADVPTAILLGNTPSEPAPLTRTMEQALLIWSGSQRSGEKARDFGTK